MNWAQWYQKTGDSTTYWYATGKREELGPFGAPYSPAWIPVEVVHTDKVIECPTE